MWTQYEINKYLLKEWNRKESKFSPSLKHMTQSEKHSLVPWEAGSSKAAHSITCLWGPTIPYWMSCTHMHQGAEWAALLESTESLFKSPPGAVWDLPVEQHVFCASPSVRVSSQSAVVLCGHCVSLKSGVRCWGQDEMETKALSWKLVFLWKYW